MDERARRSLAAGALAVAVLTAAIGLLAASVPPVEVDDRGAAGERVTDPVDRLSSVHDAGVTGENVSVGVVDVTGFDTGHDALAARTVESRSFGRGGVGNAGRNAHGTAAASLVAGVAPDADLYLANFDGVDGYERALEWLVERDVDVVVAPVSFYGTQGDGKSDPARAAAAAGDRGTLVVASAGNLARGHWRGPYDDASDGKLRFAGGTRNYLANGSRDLRLWLSWERSAADEDYTAELYWTNGSATRLVARSRPRDGTDEPSERLSVRLVGGSYFVVVRGPDRPTGTELRLVSPTHELQYRERAGSVVAPATAERVLSVGAYDTRNDRPEPFSSRGPTADGRTGVDVVAPGRLRAADRPSGFVGSSAAAPYVAGAAALALDADPDRSPAAVRAVLRNSTTDVGAPGVDHATGHGLVRPRRAVALAGNES
ncbi:S8 family serine peptidase [Halomicrobium salinisoli]|uniref:S8 family serine peptidase n=1 Tax=Halomicrobium salinisoli TaxID=2878391 RepID=UPI001CEFFBA0|nr:S8 family serine peptidase [Halomicrobium salinisoli]